MTMKKSTIALAAMAALIATGPLGLTQSAKAGTWVCGDDCDKTTFKGIKWMPGTKCAKPQAPEVNAKTPKAYNDSANNTNAYINGGNTYFTCLNDELNGDFTGAQASMNESAKTFFEKAQSEFKTSVDTLSQQLEEGLKKLNKK
jgi:hypothetical protein